MSSTHNEGEKFDLHCSVPDWKLQTHLDRCVSGVNTQTEMCTFFDLAQQLFRLTPAPCMPSPYYALINVISLNPPPRTSECSNLYTPRNIHSFWQGQIVAESAEIYCRVARVELIICCDVVEWGWVGVGGGGGDGGGGGGGGNWSIESFAVFIIRPLALAQSCISYIR